MNERHGRENGGENGSERERGREGESERARERETRRNKVQGQYTRQPMQGLVLLNQDPANQWQAALSRLFANNCSTDARETRSQTTSVGRED